MKKPRTKKNIGARLFHFALYTAPMKLKWHHLTPEHYLRHVRRQSKHIQHVHAFVFAGSITGLIAFFILYTDYGFWHEKYVAESAQQEVVPIESPGQSLGSFFKEAKERFNAIGTAAPTLLEGKEVYTSE